MARPDHGTVCLDPLVALQKNHVGKLNAEKCGGCPVQLSTGLGILRSLHVDFPLRLQRG